MSVDFAGPDTSEYTAFTQEYMVNPTETSVGQPPESITEDHARDAGAYYLQTKGMASLKDWKVKTNSPTISDPYAVQIITYHIPSGTTFVFDKGEFE